MTKEINDDVALGILGPADLAAGGMHVITANIDRLTKPLSEGFAIWAFCLNCGTYLEYSLKDLDTLARIGEFNVPNNEDIKKNYLELNCCQLCRKKIEPEIILKEIPKE